jgi:hypothetical protein
MKQEELLLKNWLAKCALTQSIILKFALIPIAAVQPLEAKCIQA